MEKILIETYRSFDIFFDTHYEKFQCVCTDEDTKESISFAAVKKFIDDYIKENQVFKPFWVVSNPKHGWEKEKLKVIGVRKDGRFVAENVKGQKVQISNYDEGAYMLYKPENETALVKLEELKIKAEIQRIENNKTKDSLISSMNITTLKEHRQAFGL